MELYRSVSYELSALLTRRYSTSFSTSSRLFDASIRADIYAIYGLVRIADEIVDSYSGADREELLNDLEVQVYAALERGYDTNPIVYAFTSTMHRYTIDRQLVAAFFTSMRMDISRTQYDQRGYETYIYGSAEVIGLMCLRIFCEGSDARYNKLTPGARALGAVYQKVNFLRDFAADYQDLGRVYFPDMTFDTFSEADKTAIINEIRTDFTTARMAAKNLPANSKAAVMLSIEYYSALLNKLERATAQQIKEQRIRISNAYKFWLYVKVNARYRVTSW